MSSKSLHNFNLTELDWAIPRRNRSNLRRPVTVNPDGHQPHPSPPIQPPPSSPLSKKESSTSASHKKSSNRKVKTKDKEREQKPVEIKAQKPSEICKSKLPSLLKPLKISDHLPSARVDKGGMSVKHKNKQVVDEGPMNSKDKKKQAADTHEESPKLKWPSFSLTPEEIAEDIYAFTGGKKPLRSRMKRSKPVQEKIDKLFPMVSEAVFNPELYEIGGPPKPKGERRRRK